MRPNHLGPAPVGTLAAPIPAQRTEIVLVDTFELRHDGAPQSLPYGAQRVCALLALRGRAMSRSEAAGTLWPDFSDERAMANLRGTLWRLRALPGPPAVQVSGQHLELGESITVDVQEIVALCRALLVASPETVASADLRPWQLRGELLPRWADLWLVSYRENLRELQISALEALCSIALATRRLPLAVESARYAIALDPLRESGWRALVDVHIHNGNLAEAAALYRRYACTLREETGMRPSPQFERLVDPVWCDDVTA